MTYLERIEKIDQMRELVGLVTYKPGWTIHFGYCVERPYIQVQVDTTTEAAICPFTGEVSAWKGGKRYLSVHMCRQEVVSACLGAIKDAEMHEIHEWFRYKGRSIYNPHTDPDALAELVSKRVNLSIRDNAMTMQEDEA